MRKILTAGVALLAACLTVVPAPGAAAGEQPTTRGTAPETFGGGSNYNWFGLDGCDREPFGVINKFHQGRDKINQQLRELREAGQQRLRFGIFHRRGPDSGTLMDSTGGRLSKQNTQNLKDFLAAVKKAGFREISVSMHVNGDNNPNYWDAWKEDYYQENLNLIRYVRPIIKTAGIPYKIDLGAELMPDDGQQFTLEHSKRTWRDYTAEFGKDDTVGFSVIGSRATRIKHIPEVYGDNPPHLLDFHFYGNEQFGDEYTQFVNAHRQLTDMGYRQGMVVSETYFNDGTAADGLRRAIDETGRQVYWLTQWPLSRHRPCGDHVDIAPPTAFDRFAAKGFAEPR